MVWINPSAVTFGGEAIDHAESVSIDREAVRAVEEYSDDGPHVVFADVPAQLAGAVLRRPTQLGHLAVQAGGEVAFDVF